MFYKRHKIEKQNFPVLNEWKATNEIGLCILLSLFSLDLGMVLK